MIINLKNQFSNNKKIISYIVIISLLVGIFQCINIRLFGSAVSNAAVIIDEDTGDVIDLKDVSDTYVPVLGKNYLVSDSNGLIKLATLVNTAGRTFDGFEIYLINDIVFSGEWTPIGNATNNFMGTFNGQDYTITGITYTSSSALYVGMFGYVGVNGEINNLNISSNMTGTAASSYTGGLVGYNAGNIQACTILSGSISGTVNVGGIVGYSLENSNIIHCYNAATIKASQETSYVGGIAGYLVDNGHINMVGCCNNASVIGKSYVAGIVGYMGSNNNVYSAGNYGSITANGDYAGGIAAYSGAGCDIYNSYNEVGANVTNSDNYFGGIVGRCVDTDIKNCYNKANITASTGTTPCYLGGIAGAIEKSTVGSNIKNAYNMGDIKADTANNMKGGKNNYTTFDESTESLGMYVGGITGSVDNGSYINVVYNTGSVLGDYYVYRTDGWYGNYSTLYYCYVGAIVGYTSSTGSIANYMYSNSNQQVIAPHVDKANTKFMLKGYGYYVNDLSNNYTYTPTLNNVNATTISSSITTTLNSYITNQSDADLVSWFTDSNTYSNSAYFNNNCPMLAIETLLVNNKSDLEQMSYSVNNGVTYNRTITIASESKTISIPTWLVPTSNNEVSLGGSAARKGNSTYYYNHTPIGTLNNKYKGTFFGMNNIISDLYLNGSSATYQALFGYVGEGAVIKNLTVSGTVTASEHVAGLVAHGLGTDTNKIVIQNCNNECSISSDGTVVGGMAGYISYAELNNNINYGSVVFTGTSKAGGFVGNIENSTIDSCIQDSVASFSINSTVNSWHASGMFGACNNCQLSRCENNGKSIINALVQTYGGMIGLCSNTVVDDCLSQGNIEIKKNSTSRLIQDIGGIAGFVENGSLIKNCINNSDINTTSTNSSGIVYDIYVTGGIAGNVASGTPVNIQNCTNNGDVNGKNQLGGIAGVFNTGNSISGCTNTGNIYTLSGEVGGVAGNSTGTIRTSISTGNIESADNNIGGIAGINNAGGTIENSYSRSAINVTSASKIAGGIVGTNAGTISNCYLAASLTLTSNTNAAAIAGVNTGTAKRCYYDETNSVLVASLLNDINNSGEGTMVNVDGMTTIAMKKMIMAWTLNQYGYPESNSGIWSIDSTGTINNGYPIFADNDHKPVFKINYLQPKNMSNEVAGSIQGYDLILSEAITDEENVYFYEETNMGVIATANESYYIEDINVTVGSEYGTNVSKEVVSQVNGTTEDDIEYMSSVVYSFIMPNNDVYVYSDNLKNTASLAGIPEEEEPFEGIVDILDYNEYPNATEYTISSVEAWEAFADLTLTKNFNNVKIHVVNDINFGGIDHGMAGSSTMPFAGKFYGNGYKLINFAVSGNSDVGIFGYVGASAIIDGVTASVTITGTGTDVGGIAGECLGIISDCHIINTTGVTSVVSGTSYVGGIAGKISGNIYECDNNATINGTDYMGGIAGCILSGKIMQSYNDGDVNASTNSGNGCVAGIVGNTSAGNIYIVDCLNTGNIIGYAKTAGVVGNLYENSCVYYCSSAGTISASNAELGGIVGYADVHTKIVGCSNQGNIVGGTEETGGIAGVTYGRIYDSYNTGNVDGYYIVGGIAGRLWGNHGGSTAAIINCYNKGSINTDTERVGGLVGQAIVETVDDIVYILNSYTTGNVTSDNGSATNIGSLVGRAFSRNKMIVENCYTTVTSPSEYVGIAFVGNENNSITVGTINEIAGEITEVSGSQGGWFDNSCYIIDDTGYCSVKSAYIYDELQAYDQSLSSKNYNNNGDLDLYDIYAWFEASNTYGYNSNGTQLRINNNMPIQSIPVVVINSKEDLVRMSYVTNEMAQTHYIETINNNVDINISLYTWLTADQLELGGIDSTYTADSNNIYNHVPIGNDTTAYNGIFVGLNHVISGIFIKRNNIKYYGLFGNTGSKTEISNLSLTNGTINVTMQSENIFAGGLVGNFNGIAIDNCSTDTDIVFENTDVNITTYLGGITGRNYGIISNCSNTGELSGNINVGGIAGVNADIIKNSFSKGSIYGEAYVGGVVGSNTGNITEYCYNQGRVEGVGDYVGGIAGIQTGTNALINLVYNIANDNDIETYEVFGSKYVGGIIGDNVGGGVCDAFNRATIMSELGYLGGVAGQNSGRIINTYSAANQISDKSVSVAGIVGNNTKKVKNSYYDNEIVTDAVAVNSSGNGSIEATLGKTTANMKNATIVSLLNDDGLGADRNVWTRDTGENKPINEGYPYFILGTGRYIPSGVVEEEEEGTADPATGTDYVNISDFPTNNVSAYQIETIEDMESFADIINAGNTMSGVTIYLANDLMYSGTNNYSMISNENVYAFAGTFDGQGYTISGLNKTTSASYEGLFGYIAATGVVINLNIDNMTITNATGYVGGIAGSNAGNISNCSVGGSITTSGNYAGGIVGINSGTVDECVNLSTIISNNSSDYIGGIVGGCTASNTLIIKCYNNGAVTSSGGLYIGGIVGKIGNLASDSYDNNKVVDCCNNAAITGAQYTAGIAGYISDNNGIYKCCNYGTISGSSTYTGGIMGELNPSASVCDSYNIGTISGGESTGGIAGKITGGTVKNSYNTGGVTGTSYVGGIAGQIERNTSDTGIYNSYNQGSILATTYTGYVGGITGYASKYVLQNGGSVANYYVYISNCYNTGTISGNTRGSIVGYLACTVTYSNCYASSTSNPSAYGGRNRNTYRISVSIINNTNNTRTNDLNTEATANGYAGWLTDIDTLGSASGTTASYLNGGYPLLKIEVIAVKTHADLERMSYVTNNGVSHFISDSAILKTPFTNDPADTPVKTWLISDTLSLSTATGKTYNHTTIGVNAINLYKGIFDGLNNSISGMNMTITSSDPYKGIFGYVDTSGCIKNLYVKSSTITITTNSTLDVGGIAGLLKGTMKHCYSDIDITSISTSTNSAGGLVGNNQGTITLSYSLGNVNAYKNVGGLVGNNQGILQDCYNRGNVTATSMNIGGIVGNNSSTGAIYTCYSTAELDSFGSDNNSAGTVGNNQGTVNSCYYEINNDMSIMPAINGTGIALYVSGKFVDIDNNKNYMKENKLAWQLNTRTGSESTNSEIWSRDTLNSLNNGYPILSRVKYSTEDISTHKPVYRVRYTTTSCADVKGSTIEENEDLYAYVRVGDEVSFKLIANNGYKLISVGVDETQLAADVAATAQKATGAAITLTKNNTVTSTTGVDGEGQQSTDVVTLDYSFTDNMPRMDASVTISTVARKFLVIYNVNSGTLGANVVSGCSLINGKQSHIYTYGDTYILPTESVETGTYTIERDYYTFEGWYTNNSFTGTSKVSITTATLPNPAANLNIYAKWEAVSYYVTIPSDVDCTNVTSEDGVSFDISATLSNIRDDYSVAVSIAEGVEASIAQVPMFYTVIDSEGNFDYYIDSSAYLSGESGIENYLDYAATMNLTTNYLFDRSVGTRRINRANNTGVFSFASCIASFTNTYQESSSLNLKMNSLPGYAGSYHGQLTFAIDYLPNKSIEASYNEE